MLSELWCRKSSCIILSETVIISMISFICYSAVRHTGLLDRRFTFPFGQSCLLIYIHDSVRLQTCRKRCAAADTKMGTFDIFGLLDYHGNQWMQAGPKQPAADEDKCANPGWQNCFLGECDRPRSRRRNQEFVIYRSVLSPDHHCLLPLHALITPSVFIRIVTLAIIHHRCWGAEGRK